MADRILRRFASVILAAALGVSMLSGCGASSGQADSDSSGSSSAESSSGASASSGKVRIALCQQSMLSQLPSRIRAQFPDVDFEFTLANNAVAYYDYLAEHEDLPDIITVRRFDLREAMGLKAHLVDLSKTEIAAAYYQNILDTFTYEDGVINFLPALGQVWDIAANKTLFEQYGIELPVDYESFTAACEAFEEQGIQGFTTDWEYDYSSLETLEGFGMRRLQSLDGKTWRHMYSSGNVSDFDAEVWMPVFERMYDMLQKTGNMASDTVSGKDLLERGFQEVQDLADNHQVAMIRSTISEIEGYEERTGDEWVLLPYPSDDSENNFLMTYPDWQAAISKDSSIDQALLMDIYSYMLSGDCQRDVDSSSNVISYSSGVEGVDNPHLANIRSYVDENRVFVRLSNDAIFAAAKKSIQGMISGEYDAAEAFDVFNQTLSEEEEEEDGDSVMITSSYDYGFDPEHGNPAASAMLNSCRKVWGTELAVGYPVFFSNDIYAGELPASKVKYLLAGNYAKNYNLRLTGAEVKKLVSIMVHYEDTRGDRLYMGLDPVCDDMLPVSSGFEMEIAHNPDGTYQLNGITVDGEPIDEERTYSIVYAVSYYFSEYILDQTGIDLEACTAEDVDKSVPTVEKYFDEYGGELEAPSDYIKLTVN